MIAIIDVLTNEVTHIDVDVPEYALTAEQLASQARAERDLLLNQSDKQVLPDRWFLMSAEQQALWTAYRQALRDLPKQSGFPAEIDWPIISI